MTFQPVVPFGGFAGWQFLQRTAETQRAAFDAAPVRQRDVDYFQERIADIGSAEELVSDRRLLTVALGAFGLDEDIGNRFFIQKVLEEGTGSSEALANRLTDTRYRQLSEAFGFGNGVLPNTGLEGFGQGISDAFLERQFEIGVGETDQTLRLALTFEREFDGIASSTISNDAKWLTIMGNPPLRQVFETALGFPRSFGALDIDRQLEDFKDRAASALGSSDLTQLAEPEAQDELLRSFLARAQIEASPSAALSSASAALTLLTQTAR
ncbi:MAG: DUF1217 domain-containing protein [Pseudomonadota bacterium]